MHKYTKIQLLVRVCLLNWYHTTMHLQKEAWGTYIAGVGVWLRRTCGASVVCTCPHTLCVHIADILNGAGAKLCAWARALPAAAYIPYRQALVFLHAHKTNL